MPLGQEPLADLWAEGPGSEARAKVASVGSSLAMDMEWPLELVLFPPSGWVRWLAFQGSGVVAGGGELGFSI